MQNSIDQLFPFLKTSFLNRNGWEIKKEKYDKNIFGNAYIIISNKELELRIIFEESNYYMDVRKDNSEFWHQFLVILEFLKTQEFHNNLKIKQQINLFNELYEEIYLLFYDKDMKSKFLSFEKKKSKKVMNNIFNNHKNS